MRNVQIYRHKLSKLLVYTFILGTASTTFSSCTTVRSIWLRNKSMKEWGSYQLEEVKKSPEGKGEKWTIYSRKIKGTKLLEYTIEGDIKATAEACIAAFKQDIHNQAADLKNKKYPTYEIVSETNDSLLTYVIHHEPFPFKDTEMSIMYVFAGDEDGTTGVSWQEAWEISPVPVSKKLSRVGSFRGSWHFASTSDNSCLSTNKIQFNPKGMPEWLFKPMVMKFLKNGLASLREAALKQAQEAIGCL